MLVKCSRYPAWLPHPPLSPPPPPLHMQGSRWTLQALRMNGQLGELQIQPDQMQALNPILILVFIPIFEIIIYPLFAKCHLLKKWVYLLMQYYWWAHRSMHRFSSPLYIHIVL